MQKHRDGQSGSVLIYILIAVALFAALAMVVSSMMRSGQSISDEKIGVFASEVVDYARAMRDSVQAMKISNACEDTQISFEKPPFDGSDTDYVNSKAPSDRVCHIFHPKGGGVGYQENYDDQRWRFTSALAVADVGGAETELLATLPVKKEVCRLLNERAGVEGADLTGQILANDGADGENPLLPFTGMYTDGAQLSLDPYRGKMSGCYISEGLEGPDYTFYQVLISR